MISFFICSVLLIFSECSDLSVLTALTTKCLVSCVDSQIGDGWCDSPWCDGCESFTTDGIFDGDDCMFDLSEVAVGKEAPEEVAVGIADVQTEGASYLLSTEEQALAALVEKVKQKGKMVEHAVPASYLLLTEEEALAALVEKAKHKGKKVENAVPESYLLSTEEQALAALVEKAKQKGKKIENAVPGAEEALAALVEKAKQKGKVENAVPASYLLSTQEKAVAAQNAKLRKTNRLLLNALRELQVGQLSDGANLYTPPPAYNPFGTHTLGPMTELTAPPLPKLSGIGGLLGGIKDLSTLGGLVG